MSIALIDNGSLEPAAHRNLRAMAAALAARSGLPVTAVSWKHSDRIPAEALDGRPAWTVGPWIRAGLARGEREFVLVPFFISAQGAIGSALRADLEELRRTGGDFAFSFAPGLAEIDGGARCPQRASPAGDVAQRVGDNALHPGPSALAAIVADRVRETIAAQGLRLPPVIVVDHGGPSPASAALRNAAAAEVRAELGESAGPLAAASLESPEGPDFAFNRPLFAAQLGSPGFDRGDVVVAPLFLAPGRHAGPQGDLAQIARAAEVRCPGLRCRFTGLVGTHPLAVEALAQALAGMPATAP